MRSKIAKRILDETPEDTRIFVRLHADIVVRIHQLLRKKGWTQKDLAERLDKVPSEISKWLSGKHNLTLQSIAKLHAELGSEIIYVPKPDSYHVQRGGGSLKATATKAEPVSTKVLFQETKSDNTKLAQPVVEPVAA